MWEKLRVVITIPELRQKIMLTLLCLAIYRVGYQIPLPVVDSAKMQAQTTGNDAFGKFVQQLAVFSASNLNQATIFGLGIMPYISASIIFQLLGTVWKPVEDLKKEGEAGRRKITEYTRYATVVLCLVQSWFYVWSLTESRSGESMIHSAFLSDPADPASLYWHWFLIAVLTMTCGSVFLMWLGEQIDEYGIGNGISLLIMAGIVAQMPGALYSLLGSASFELVGLNSATPGLETLIALAFSFVGVVTGVVFITLGQRRIRTQSAKHVRGRRVYGGSHNYLPLRINQAGVMPIIFASSLLMIPTLLFGWIGGMFPSSAPIMGSMSRAVGNPLNFTHNVLYVGLIYFFCYFWTAITFNPKEMADNLKDYGTFIPGYRPGKRTAEYLEKVMVRITYVGAGFLALVAVIPTMISTALNVDFMVASFYGGTGLLIAVSVAFDLVQKIDSHLVMRNYRGLLE
jgi:preprotein translocase subunit SecY